MTVFSHADFDDHEQVVFFSDTRSGLRAIVAIHDTRLGPALGGCRMWPYADDAAALTDVLRLSRGMTYKSAMANLPLGGGKAVIVGDPRQDKTEALLRAMGDSIEKLGGRYITAEDSGTTVADMKVIRERTRNVAGIVDGAAHGGDPSIATAYGTYVGLKAAVRFALSRSDLQGLKVAIQGVGNVGYHLARHLREAGAELYVSDLFAGHVERAVGELGAIAVAPDAIYGLDVDVFAPCAMGAALNPQTLPVIKARVIAGSANNQLQSADIGRQLLECGITYAPDYVINAGGIIDVACRRAGLGDDDINQRLEDIAASLYAIFARSRLEQESTAVIADRIAMERLYQNASCSGATAAA